MSLTQNLYKRASTIYVEALDDDSLAIYNEKHSETQIISSDFNWLISLLSTTTSYSEIAKQFALTYPDTQTESISEQVDELLNVFIQNRIIDKVA